MDKVLALLAEKILLLRTDIAFPNGYPLPNWPKLVMVMPMRVL